VVLKCPTTKSGGMWKVERVGYGRYITSIEGVHECVSHCLPSVTGHVSMLLSLCGVCNSLGRSNGILPDCMNIVTVSWSALALLAPNSELYEVAKWCYQEISLPRDPLTLTP
jgi:hypothetical protein